MDVVVCEEEEVEADAAGWEEEEEEGVAVRVELGEVCSSARSLCLKVETDEEDVGESSWGL